MIQPTIDTTIDTSQELRTTPGYQVRKYGITWWWCDGSFRGPPMLVQLGNTLNDPSHHHQPAGPLSAVHGYGRTYLVRDRRSGHIQ